MIELIPGGMLHSRILIVHEDEEQLNFLRQYIAMQDYETEIVKTGEEVIGAMDQFHPDLIVMNLFLPGLSGIEVLREIREREDLEQIPVIIMSSDDSDEARIVCLSSGANDYITSPLSLPDLSIKIQNSLEMLGYRRQILNLNAKLAKEKSILLRYFSPDLVEKILNEEIRPELGGQTLNGTVMFFDIRGSTPLAERIGPKLYASFISDLFARLFDIIFSHQGSVNELLGDGILASFGCPVEIEEHRLFATKAALDIRNFFKEFNQSQKPDYLPDDIRFGVGIASGKIFAGNIGSAIRLKYAVMGDPVNTAARIQELARDLNTDILVDENTAKGCNGSVHPQVVGSYQLRGKVERVNVYKV